MCNEQQNIQNDAPNQGAQGQFHGDVNTGTQQDVSGERAVGIGGDANAPVTTGNQNTVANATVQDDNSGQNIGANTGGANQTNQNGHRVDGIQYVAARDIYINQNPAERQKEASRSDQQAAPHTVQWARATLTLEGDPTQFTAQEREALILVLSRILKVSEDQIRILRVTEGSIKVELELPEEAAQKLKEMQQNDDPALQQLSPKLLHTEIHTFGKPLRSTYQNVHTRARHSKRAFARAIDNAHYIIIDALDFIGAIARDHTHTLIITIIIAAVLAVTRDLAVTAVVAVAVAVAVAVVRVFGLDLAFAIAFNRARSNKRDLARALARALARDLARDQHLQSYALALALALKDNPYPYHRSRDLNEVYRLARNLAYSLAYSKHRKRTHALANELFKVLRKSAHVWLDQSEVDAFERAVQTFKQSSLDSKEHN
jgi:hypothetical protein